MSPDKNADVSTHDIFRMLRGDFLPSDIHARRAEKERAKVQAFKVKQIEEQFGHLSTLDLMQLKRRRKLAYFRTVNSIGFVYDAAVEDEVKFLLSVLASMISRRTDVPHAMKSRVAQRREKARVNRGQGKSKNR